MNAVVTLSSHLPDLIDQYIKARDQRLELDRQSEDIKKYEEGLKKTIIAKMREERLEVAGERGGFVKLSEKVEPDPQDWTALWKHIQETGHFELLHKRVTAEAVRERWLVGEEVPGIGRKIVYNLSVSRS